MDKRALITGVAGQDGSYLSELLLSKGYEVYGLIWPGDPLGQTNLAAISDRLKLMEGDIRSQESVDDAIKTSEPDEVYNLAAQAFVRLSFDSPIGSAETTGLSVMRVLEAVRRYAPMANVYQASTSELFGASPVPQSERTPFYPRSPYGIAKLFGYWTTVNYREAYHIFATNGILFNHDSPRRPKWAVTRKVSYRVAQIAYGLADELTLGNLYAKRDWGYAKEYVESMWRMLQHDEPDDFVIATGESHSVRELVEEAFRIAGIDDWESYIKIDPKHYRPSEVDHLQGDASKAKRVLGWEPKVKFKKLVKLMVDAVMKMVGELD